MDACLRTQFYASCQISVNVHMSLWPQFPYLYNFKNNIDASSPDVMLRSQNEILDTTRVSCDVIECFCRSRNADLSAQVPRVPE